VLSESTSSTLLTEDATGLQTPRLKRLAEIVSAQAIAQQEKLDYTDGDEFDEQDELDREEEVEVEA
jgi:myosin-5